jgi:uncharacterized protein (DUF1501 family)
MIIKTRRDFLRASVKSVAALGAMSGFGRMSALAGSPSPGYQALVCIYLAGGNDGHNTVVPNSTAGYAQYKSARQGLAIAQSSLLPIGSGTASYGLHPSMSAMQGLYNQGHAAVVANVGNLVGPLSSVAQYKSAAANSSASVPVALFSHSDQSSQWQSGSPSETLSNGWGGRMVDAVNNGGANSGAQFPAIASVGGCGLFCTGVSNFPASVPPPYSSGGAPTGVVGLNTGVIGPAAAGALSSVMSFDNGVQLVQAGNTVLGRGNQYATTLTNLLKTNQVSTSFPANNLLADQLLTVANVISVRAQLGITRQIFFCQLGGFDTHSDQLATQQNLLGLLSQAVGAFYQAMSDMGLANSVTAFTASEFGRSLQPSGADGSDHGWTSHHFVMGGAVQGGKVYGSFPSMTIGSSADDATGRGVFIPGTAIAQYGATLANWFGVDSASMAGVFPNIGQYGTQNLGFLG